MNMKAVMINLTAAAAVLTSLACHAVEFKAQKASPTFTATAAAKPATCGKGFTAVGKKLINHEGKKWYEYTCARQEVIIRTCNADTQVTNVKNNFISLPSDGKSKNSKLNMSYKCFNYVPVE